MPRISERLTRWQLIFLVQIQLIVIIIVTIIIVIVIHSAEVMHDKYAVMHIKYAEVRILCNPKFDLTKV